MKKFTLAIPNYDGEKTLEKCIRSCKFISISPNDYEILVVDNNSKDSSLKIIEKLKQEFSNLRLEVNDRNIGRVQNWNRSLKLARGKFIMLISANDYLHENNNIHEIVKILDKDESISSVVSYFVTKSQEQELLKRKYFNEMIKCDSKKFVFTCVSRGLLPFPTQAIIFRTDDVITKKNFFPEDMQIAGDQVFTCFQLCVRKNILFNPHPLSYWTVGNRFHYGIKFNDLLNETKKATELISKKLDCPINHSFFVTYTFGRYFFEMKIN